MVTLLEHLRERHRGLARYLIGTSLAVVVIGIILFVYFLCQERSRKAAGRAERRERHRRVRRQKR